MDRRAGSDHPPWWRCRVRVDIEANRIAARLASTSQRFPLPHNDVDGRSIRDSTVYVESADAVLSICVTDYDGTRREYRAVVQLVAASDPDVRVPR